VADYGWRAILRGCEGGGIDRSTVPTASPADLAGEVLGRLAGPSFETATDVVVLDGGRLLGVVPIGRLLAASPATPVAELADEAIVVDGADLELAARRAAAAGRRVVAVVRDGAFDSLIGPEELVQILERGHEEDMARLGGYRSRAAMAKRAAGESLPRRLWHRLPWLGIGLAGAMGSAVIVGWFEDELRKEVLLALFIPAVVYMADAVGTQTETLVIRGMAAGIPIREVFARELATGAITGALIGAAFFPFALALWGDADVAASVALALGVSCSIATLVAMVLPYALARLGRDPAYGSGPLATVIQDLLSVIVYFAVASALV
jgi:magnesium transporter